MREIVNQQVERSWQHYERTIGNPRHAANQELLHSIKGGIRVLKWMGTASVALATLYIGWFAAHHK